MKRFILSLVILLSICAMSYAASNRVNLVIQGNTTNATFVMSPDTVWSYIAVVPCNSTGYTRTASKGNVTAYVRMNIPNSLYGNEWVKTTNVMYMANPVPKQIQGPYREIRLIPDTIPSPYYKVYLIWTDK